MDRYSTISTTCTAVAAVQGQPPDLVAMACTLPAQAGQVLDHQHHLHRRGGRSQATVLLLPNF